MSIFSDEESELLDQIATAMALEKLHPFDQTLIAFRFAFDPPDDYGGPWPSDCATTGEYVGRKYLGRPMSATRAHYHTTRILAAWRRRHPEISLPLRADPLNATSIADSARFLHRVSHSPIHREQAA